MAEERDFLELERAFAAHLRDPERFPAPEGIEDRRLRIYRDLFRNNVRNLLAGTYKVSKRILGDDAWSALTQEFRSEHRCVTPYFLVLPVEFRDWLHEERGLREGEPPFLLELTHYESLGLIARFDAAAAPEDVDQGGDLIAGEPVVTPQAWPLVYRYPVHRIRPEFQPEEPPEQPTCLLVHRDAEHQVHFTEINPLTARLIELMQEATGRSGRELLTQIAGEFGVGDTDAVLTQGATLLEDLRTQGVVLGARR